MEKEYVVIVHKGVDLAAFDADLAASTGDSPIPNRSVQVADPREGSKRMTHWMLTDEEAKTLESDQRIYAVEIPPHLRDNVEFVLDARSKKGGRFKRGGTKTANDVNWGLARSNAKANIFYGAESVISAAENDYLYALDGAGVDVVIQDTGIQADHPEWQDRTGNSRLQQIDWYAESGISGTQHADHYTDHDGHGTHVAGVIAGKTYGWAKGANIYAQKLSAFGGSGGIDLGTSPSTAFDMIRLWHNNKANGRPTVVNMSWGLRFKTNGNPVSGFHRGSSWSFTGQSDNTLWSAYGIVGDFDDGYRYLPMQSASYDVEIEEMIEAGIHVCISAGNSYYKADVPGGVDYNNYVVMPITTNGVVSNETIKHHRPASPYHENAYFVGNISSSPRISSRKDDAAEVSSVRGPAVNVWAPGTDIMSASASSASGSEVFNYPDNSNFKIQSMTGTSQASPQVAGVLALHLQSQPYISPAKLMRKVVDDAVEGIIEDSNHQYITVTGSLLDGPNIFLRSRYGVANPFSVAVPQQGGSGGSGVGSETGSGGVNLDPDTGEAITEFGTQSGFLFFTQSGEEIVIQ